MNTIKDKSLLNKIHKRLTLLLKGFLVDVKHIENGIFETRIHVGGGVRIYFYLHGSTLIVLLCGGLKRTQKKDIAQAIKYAIDFKERTHE